VPKHDAVSSHRVADDARAAGKPGRLEQAEHTLDGRRLDLQHRTEFLRVQCRRGQRCIPARQVRLDAAMTGKCHFGQRDERAAVRAIVVGKQQARVRQAAHGREEGAQQLRLLAVRGRATQPAVDLRKAGPSKPVSPAPEVDEHEPGFAPIHAQLR
jgi:hypothetical protein